MNKNDFCICHHTTAEYFYKRPDGLYLCLECKRYYLEANGEFTEFNLKEECPSCGKLSKIIDDGDPGLPEVKNYAYECEDCGKWWTKELYNHNVKVLVEYNPSERRF